MSSLQLPSSNALPPSGANSSSNNNNNNEDAQNRRQNIPPPILERTGRVVRLHFSCRAALPMGSFLRVTGSTLWAPGTAAFDPTDAAQALAQTSTNSFVMTANIVGDPSSSSNGNNGINNHDDDDDEEEAGGNNHSFSRLYASSVEMVTSPETYPVWRTRKPVVVVVHHSRKSIQHHYYRYLVVTPGYSNLRNTNVGTTGILEEDEENSSVMDESEHDYLVNSSSIAGNNGGGMVVSTSNETIGTTAVMQWENPFNAKNKATSSSSSALHPADLSALSLNSSSWHGNTSVINNNDAASTVMQGQGSSRTAYRNLPYRTVDIDVLTGKVLTSGRENQGDEDNEDEDADVDSEKFEERIDHWNNAEDLTFRPYLIREAIHEENRRKAHLRNPSSNSLPLDFDNNITLGNEMDLDTIAIQPTPPQPEISSTVTTEPTSGALTPMAFSSNHRIFFVCFHLPVVVVQNQTTKVWRVSWSESILAGTEGSQILSTYQAYWVGTLTTHPPLKTEQDKEQVRQLLQSMNCIPIFLSNELRQAHYYGFCKQVLWPAFHNIDLLDLSTCGWLSDQEGLASDWDQSRLDNWWRAYVQVNRVFVSELAALVRPNDLLWIHDYHLSLLPQYLQEWECEKYGCKITRKVFFLHIPFPTSQIFRELECGEQILQGMLHADVVGFHAFDHARHFLNAAKRILGLNYESLVGGLIGVSFQSNTVLVSMSNVSIEPRMVDAALMLPSVQAGRDAIKSKHDKRKIIGAVDIGQRLSGIALKLLAYEHLLQDYPTWQKKVVLVQRVLLPGSRKMDENVTSSECRALVQRIQSKFGHGVIDYQEIIGNGMPMDQRLALWLASDVLMNTPIREGLNHWPMEYIHARKEPVPAGVVITSEFSANSSILNGALRVNPYDIQETVTTIDKALDMGRQEREGRRYRDIDFVSTSPSDKWVKNVLRDLRDATMRQSRSSEANSSTTTPHDSQTPLRKDQLDCTAAFLAHEGNHAFTHLSSKALQKAFNASNRRVIITDFNGTIVLKEPPSKYLKREILGTSGNKPPEEVISALAKLSEDDRNIVYVVSGDSVENVMSALGHLPYLGLAVSNGASFSPPLPKLTNSDGSQQHYNHPQSQRRWFTFDLGVDWDAVKRAALPVLSKYTARSNGSFVKLTSFSIGWSYYSCDPEWGSLQAVHLVLELEHVLRAYDVRFVTLKGIVEVVPRKLNKGLIVKKVLRDTAATEPVDFVLCLGDDISDEKMFTSVFSFFAEIGDDTATKSGPAVIRDDGKREEPEKQRQQGIATVPDYMYSYTVAVGKKPTHASSYVNDAQDVANALVLLAEGSVPKGGVPVWGRDSMRGSSSMFE